MTIQEILSIIAPILVALMASAPMLIDAVNKRKKEKKEEPKVDAQIWDLFAKTSETLLAPQNDRIKMLEEELRKEKRINRLSNTLIRTKGNFVSKLLTIVEVLSEQIEGLNSIPAYKLNGELQKYTDEVKAAKDRLEKLELEFDEEKN